MHNLIFSDTAYILLGFIEVLTDLYAVVWQPFIIADGQAELEDIRNFWNLTDFKIPGGRTI
nr:hypothetical protein [Ferruginibacter sp.]